MNDSLPESLAMYRHGVMSVLPEYRMLVRDGPSVEYNRAVLNEVRRHLSKKMLDAVCTGKG